LRERAAGPSVSDGDLAAYGAMACCWEDTAELAPGHGLVVDTTRPIAENVAAVLNG
jgi:hypothetical protein